MQGGSEDVLKARNPRLAANKLHTIQWRHRQLAVEKYHFHFNGKTCDGNAAINVALVVKILQLCSKNVFL